MNFLESAYLLAVARQQLFIIQSSCIIKHENKWKFKKLLFIKAMEFKKVPWYDGEELLLASGW